MEDSVTVRRKTSLIVKMLLVILHGLFILTLIPWYTMVALLPGYWAQMAGHHNMLVFFSLIGLYPVIGLGLEALAWKLLFLGHPGKAVTFSLIPLLPAAYILVTTMSTH